MNQDQNVDNDLQKAIDDITKTTSVDPVFSDPVAAPSSIPEGDTGKIEPVGPFPEPIPEPVAPPVSEEPSLPEPEIAPEPVITEPEAPISEEAPQNATEVKKAALRDLAPLMGKVHMEDTERFKIYRDMFEELKDYTVLEPAYQAARGIADEEERAEALLYLVQAIDKM